MDKIPTAPRVCKRQSDISSQPRAVYGTVNSTEERAAKEVIGDGKAAENWRAAAVLASQWHLYDLHRELAASRAVKARS